MKKILVLLSVFVFNLQTHGQTQQKKFAIVIGVSNYTYASPLKNTINDANDIASSLKNTNMWFVNELTVP